MIRSVDPSAEMFLADLARIETRIGQAQRQISTGLKVTSPSDAPDQISDILQLRADIERNSQIRTNLDGAKTEVDAAEKTLEVAAQLVDRARVLGIQGAGTLPTAQTRLTLAQEVGGLHEQLVALSRNTVDGRFIFSGDADQLPAYQLNLANPNGVDRLVTAAATRQIEHPSGTSFAASQTAQDIFDHRNADDTLASDNVFAAVNGLRVALENNDQPGIDAALVALRQAGDHLNTALSFYGTRQNQIDAAIDYANKFELQLKAELSQKQDADLPAASMQLTQGQTQHEAALAAQAKRPKTSLFDYLR